MVNIRNNTLALLYFIQCVSLFCCMVEKCDQILSIYVSPPPIQEQFFLIFHIYTVYSLDCINLKCQQKIFKNERLDTYLQNLQTFEILWRISQLFYWSKSTSYWNIFYVQKYFSLFLMIWYELYSDYLV